VTLFFPGAGFLVLSAWCLGVLNSHRKFFLSYAAPVVWNLAIIIALVAFGPRAQGGQLALVAAWGSLVGSVLQFGIQLPTVIGLLRGFRPVLERTSESVRTVIRNFSRCSWARRRQISAFIDTIPASLAERAVAGLANAQVLYTLPVSLFGMSVSAAELPEMSSAIGDEAKVHEYLRGRLDGGLRRIAFLVVPCAVAFLAFGHVIASALFQSGRFGTEDSIYVWGILAGSAVGLLAATLGRLYASTYYALQDTRTPLRFAVLRVFLTTALGYLCAIPLPGWLGIEARWGAAGLTASAGLAAWVEFHLLRASLNRQIGKTGLAPSYLIRLWIAALVAGLAGWGILRLLGETHPVARAAVVLVPFGMLYVAILAGWRVPEAGAFLARIRRRIWKD
jgi:putative peptidoglycan lipid II flippase